MTPDQQRPLFPDEREKCRACAGTGRRMNHELGWRDERPCISCGGTGKQADRPDPTYTQLPKGY